MSWLLKPYQSTDGRMLATMGTPYLFPSGAFYVQNGASAALASSTTETSILNNVKGSIVQLPWDNQGSFPGSTLYFPSGTLRLGTQFHAAFVGTIANTGTPTLRTRFGLVDASAAFTAIADTAAVAMTTVASSAFIVQCDFIVASVGASGSLVGWVSHQYGPTASEVVSLPAAVTIDTTANYSLDLRCTWGTSSASNTLRILYGSFELVG
jgi:hypothetical protein